MRIEFPILSSEVKNNKIIYTREHGIDIISGEFSPQKIGDLQKLSKDNPACLFFQVGLVGSIIGMRVHIILQDREVIVGDSCEKFLCRKKS